MLKNGPTFHENLAVIKLQGFKNMFGHFSTLCIKGSNPLKQTIVVCKPFQFKFYLLLTGQ